MQQNNITLILLDFTKYAHEDITKKLYEIR